MEIDDWNPNIKNDRDLISFIEIFPFFFLKKIFSTKEQLANSLYSRFQNENLKFYLNSEKARK